MAILKKSLKIKKRGGRALSFDADVDLPNMDSGLLSAIGASALAEHTSEAFGANKNPDTISRKPPLKNESAKAAIAAGKRQDHRGKTRHRVLDAEMQKLKWIKESNNTASVSLKAQWRVLLRNEAKQGIFYLTSDGKANEAVLKAVDAEIANQTENGSYKAFGPRERRKKKSGPRQQKV